MSEFKQYLIESASTDPSGDVKASIRKLPKAHQKLVKGYEIKFTGNNTLKDGASVGLNNLKHKKMVVASPWNYGREFAFLHEIGHLVWRDFVAPHKEKVTEWGSIVRNTKGKLRQNAEELFCHAYANTYAQNKIEVHNHPRWEKFVKKV